MESRLTQLDGVVRVLFFLIGIKKGVLVVRSAFFLVIGSLNRVYGTHSDKKDFRAKHQVAAVLVFWWDGA